MDISYRIEKVLKIDERGSKIARNSVFDCHLSPVGRQMAFENFVSNDLYMNIYLNAKVSQLLLKCNFLLFEPNLLLHDIMINKSNDLPSKQHENQTSETYDC